MSLVLGSVVLGILSGGIYALMAVGLTLSFGVLEVVNIAQGMFVIAAAYLSYALQRYWHIDPLLGLVITIPVMFLLGLVVEWSFIRRLKQDRVMLSILVSWAVALILEGVVGLIFADDFRSIHSWYVTATVPVFGLYVPDIYLIGFALAVVLMGLVYLLVYRSRFGAALRAMVQNREAAALLGIDVQRISTLTFAIATGLTAAGGMLFGAIQAFNADSNLDLISRLLIIVILGGMGSMGGALVASVGLLVAVNIIAVTWTPNWSTFFFFGITILVLVFRPQGFFGAPAARKV